MIDDKHLRIKDAVQGCYNSIKKANEDLETLRDMCEHPQKELCTYQWAPGHLMNNVEVCSICGEITKDPFAELAEFQIKACSDTI